MSQAKINAQRISKDVETKKQAWMKSNPMLQTNISVGSITEIIHFE